MTLAEKYQYLFTYYAKRSKEVKSVSAKTCLAAVLRREKEVLNYVLETVKSFPNDATKTTKQIVFELKTKERLKEIENELLQLKEQTNNQV